MFKSDFLSWGVFASWVFVILSLAGCGGPSLPSLPSVQQPGARGQIQLEQVSYSQLDGWENDNLLEMLPALVASCGKITSGNNSKVIGRNGLGGVAGDWIGPCGAVKGVTLRPTTEHLRNVLMEWFRPWLVKDGASMEGTFTGYFEPELRGSRRPSGKYIYPIYGLPRELKNGPLPDGDKFLSRQEIEKGQLKNQGLELLWVDDPVDLHIMHIQGSGRVILPDGKIVNVGYAGNNGWPFTGIGKILEQKGKLSSGKGNMVSVRSWLKSHPSEAPGLMAENPRYVFFRILPNEGPVGAQGVVLTGGRSIAIDPQYIPLGVPLWLETEDYRGQPLHRLMVAQDTGSAIKGVVRGDFFWGSGEEAFQQAGRMKSRGHYYLLLPLVRSGSLAKQDQDFAANGQ